MKARSGAHPAVRQLRQRGFNAEEGGEAPRLLFWDGEVHLKNHYTKEDRSYCLSRHPCHPTPPEMTAKEWVSTINTNTMTRDPICGMTVNPDSALHAERDGETQYFCSEDCREQFMAAPVGGPRAGPCVVVIFGASGDLTKRKLLPALCNLVASGLMAEDFVICMMGDTTLFHRADMVEAAWKMAEPILTTWANEPGTALPDYSPGTWGPPEAGNLHPWQSR